MDVELRTLFEHNGNNEGPQVAQLWAGSPKDPMEKWQPTAVFLPGEKKKNLMDRGAWQITAHGVIESQTKMSMHADTGNYDQTSHLDFLSYL